MHPLCLCNVPDPYLAIELNGEVSCGGKKSFATVASAPTNRRQELGLGARCFCTEDDQLSVANGINRLAVYRECGRRNIWQGPEPQGCRLLAQRPELQVVVDHHRQTAVRADRERASRFG